MVINMCLHSDCERGNARTQTFMNWQTYNPETMLGELNPKIKFVLFDRMLKISYIQCIYIFQFLIPLLHFWDTVFQFLSLSKLHIWRSIGANEQWHIGECYIFGIIKTKSLQNVYTCLMWWEKHTHMITSLRSDFVL